jgi:hypothetical protein
LRQQVQTEGSKFGTCQTFWIPNSNYRRKGSKMVLNGFSCSPF